MKYKITHYPASYQPLQVEENQWEMQWEPEFWVVEMVKECQGDDELMKKIINHYTKRGTWAISNLVYFYKESEITLFRLSWA